ncbi:MAG: tRNA (N6-threonylcarbamoyladenosine(37)-N6)-methyltransferase TrmO [Lachnospiraceae bacterium]|nr:tRNA (N6-threonylcarbamoyladenosine(37)-N6)-methyltransferase TrmO [Lachnospiraceae bacterium]
MFEAIGTVKSNATEKVDHNWGDIVSEIIIKEELQIGLKGLEDFSHVIIIYHLSEASFIKEKHLTRKPQGRDDMPTVGIFSQRAKDRPNAIGVTSVKLLSIEQNIVKVQGLDAINGTPILDIKPYYPQYDMKENATVPEWVNVLMADYF